MNNENTQLTQDEIIALAAMEKLLDSTDDSDWPLFHSTVRAGVSNGEYSKTFESQYEKLVDKKANERESIRDNMKIDIQKIKKMALEAGFTEYDKKMHLPGKSSTDEICSVEEYPCGDRLAMFAKLLLQEAAELVNNTSCSNAILHLIDDELPSK